MFAVHKKLFLVFVVMVTVLTTGAWQGTPLALAQDQGIDAIEAPLYPGLTWSEPGISSQNIRTSINGDLISLQGKRYEANERFLADTPLPQDLVDYYSNEQLGLAGWVSYDASDTQDGVHYVFSHESGAYLSVEFLKCQEDLSKTCVTVWMSDLGNLDAVSAAAITSEQTPQATSGTFGKISPANGTSNLNPTSVKLSWDTYSPTPDKYSYCVQEGSACATNDPDWTSTYSTSVTLNNLGNNKTYYWQVKAITCVTCTPKTVVYANGGTAWYFKTSTSAEVTILGNAGVSSAVLSYVINTTNKTVTSDSTGAYSLKVPYNWSGTLTPSKTGYMFTPKSASFTNLTASQTIQNFAATPAYTISGNAGRPGVTLSYLDGTAKTVVSDGSGNYSISVPAGWSGTVTPSLTNYSFTPPSRTYTPLAANQTGQNYTATFITYNISGNVGVAGVTLSYTDTTAKAVTSNSDGSYSLQVSNNWSGRVTPSHPCFTFDPGFTDYTNVTENKTGQNYTKTLNSAAGCATVDVKIGINQQGTYGIPSGGRVTPQYPVLSGPVTAVSTNSTNVFASERVHNSTGFINEVMGVPNNQLTNEYWFPWYDNKTMQTWILIGNPSTSATAHVDIYISGVKQSVLPYEIGPGQSITPTFPILNGPVRIVSDINVFTSMRVHNATGFINEVAGIPNNKLADEYWFPWYDNQSMQSWIVVGNPSTSATAHVDIYIAGVKQNAVPYEIGPGKGITPTFPILNGPVRIVSDIDVFTSERVHTKQGFVNEAMGMPDNQLTTRYWFPWYDNMSMQSWILVGKP